MLLNKFNVERFVDIFPHMEEILHCGVFTYSYEDKKSYWSKGVYDILGLEPYSVDTVFDLAVSFILPEDKERVMRTITEAREKKTGYEIDFSLLNAKGIYKRVHAVTYIKTNDLGLPFAYSGIVKDITESYFYKKALEQKVLQLDKSNKNLQEFVYVASHDLQEPLRKISTFVERLKSRFEPVLNEEGNLYVNRILNSSNNMQILLEDLLNFSRLSPGDKEFELVSLQECMNSVLNDLEIKIEETKARVSCDHLPEIEAYPSQIKQLFANLMSNALKFRKPGVDPDISITCDEVYADAYPHYPLLKTQKYVRVVIRDNGIGFEQEFAERIFMIFQRLNGKAEFAGSGIGLSICKKIAENHHGFIFAEGELQQGSVFTVLLPSKQN